ncbi:MAG TPA: shikimate dehydrogenase [Gemmatimonadaceae bacterium]
MTTRPSRLVLLGHPVHHSRSPLFQNAALRACGVPIGYEALDVAPAKLESCLAALVAERAAGNVTIPHKERVASLCAHRTPVAERAGAVNVFWVDDRGALAGDNTDVGGFEAMVRALLGQSPRDLRVALLGAGGAAAAVLTAVERWPGCAVTIWNRGAARAHRMAERHPAVEGIARTAAAAARGARLVVNATPVGLHDDALPLPLDALAPGAAVADLVYRPGETAWVRGARANGHPAADGRAMLVEQGALAFERWLGIPAPREVMRRALAGA